ncbi:MAG: phosphotransferase family protein [Acidimicrobiales bacterium]
MGEQSRSCGVELSAEEVTRFLKDTLDLDAAGVVHVADGAWSSCFGFAMGDCDLVIRFGDHAEDYLRDERASRWASRDLPIPEVTEIGSGLGTEYAISQRASGTPLEDNDWAQLGAAIARLLESLRLADLGNHPGWGRWDGSGAAAFQSWREYLLSVESDAPQTRTSGWRAKLEQQAPVAFERFRQWHRLLETIAVDDVPRSLVHRDLVNANVHARKAQITGVFDWGESIYGDHLYDLAVLDFWSPWLPKAKPQIARSELDAIWERDGIEIENRQERFAACYLHIGLDHIAYNAHRNDWSAVAAVSARTTELTDDA